MQQRSEAPDSVDDFPTPPWATRALCEQLKAEGRPLDLQHVWEPACNRGYMAKPLGEYFDLVHATDVADYGYSAQDGVADFLIDWDADAPDVDWVITNPPFRLAQQFILQALRYARVGVAVLVRTAFVEGGERYEGLFRDRPEDIFMPFVERVVMWRGVLLDPDVPIWNEKRRKMAKPTSATSYCWMVFFKDRLEFPRLQRIAPCRKKLTRPGDYPALPERFWKPSAPDLLNVGACLEGVG
ncbi:class I SAM-dependent methyltransferase [Albibacillus kandeliae]|uniref:hypothetical protein n=1 Tax=Albibacillus kandeliae TaxID=2174228 RepID=UPI0018E4F219|nr:hypothetical protein [Albibacillus kandeliae]